MTPSYLTFFIEGFAVAFFGILAMNNLFAPEQRLRRILGGILLYWALQHILSTLFLADLTDKREISRLINVFDMTATPTCCFLLLELCKPGWLTWGKVWLNELPFLVLGFMFAITEWTVLYYINVAFFAAYGLGVFVLALFLIPRYNRSLKQFYSYEENINLNWVYAVVATFLTLMVIYAVCCVYDNVLVDILYAIGSIVAWGMICYFSVRQQGVISEIQGAASTVRQEHDARHSADLPDLAPLIQRHFIDTQLFLNPQLKLGEMAAAVGTNRTYLSRYLNDTLHTNFYDYVNSLRLEHALSLIEENKYSIKAVSVVAGFNSYSTFRRVFIAKYGVPPSNFKTL